MKGETFAHGYLLYYEVGQYHIYSLYYAKEKLQMNQTLNVQKMKPYNY